MSRRRGCGGAALVAGLLLPPVLALAETPAESDSLQAEQILAAESSVDSLRAEMRKLDREIQQLKQDLADGGDVERLLDLLAEPGSDDVSAPEDTRSRRQRVDTLLKAITQRPGQIRLNGGATAVAQTLVGGDESGSAGTGSLDLYAHTSFGPNTLLFFAFEAIGGDGLAGLVPLATPLNGDAGSTRSAEGFDHLIVLEGWAEFTRFGEAVVVTVGRIDLTNYFDINLAANDETAQFLSGAFVNSAALAAPAPSPGVRARTTLFGRFSLQAGFASGDSTGGTRFEDVFSIGAVGMKLLPESDHEGNLRVYVYVPPSPDSSTGWGVSVDQRVAGRLAVFGRFGRNDDDLSDAFGVETAWSAGIEHGGTVRGRDLTVAAAYGDTRLRPDGVERTFETYASLQLNPWTFVSPHLQIVDNDVTMSGAATALGLRVQFNF